MTTSGPVPIKNVTALMVLTERLIGRGPNLPGFGVFNGHSGYGKSMACIFVQNRLNALYVEVGDTWSRRTLLTAILTELGMPPINPNRATLSDLASAAVKALGDDPTRPLIVDEADKCVDKGMIELVRELQDKSHAPIVLVGEEMLPSKLLKIERVHNRVLDYVMAQKCDIDDAAQLAHAFAPKLAIEPNLLAAIVSRSDGRARRIVTNIHHAEEIARNKGLKKIDLDAWGNRPWHTSEPPLPRSVQPFKSAGSAVPA